MSVVVHTARISYRGSDRLDITRKSGREGIVFAPSWSLLGPVLRARTLSNHKDWPETWARYCEGFFAEMRLSYRTHRAAWDAMLSRSEVTLCCYCVDHERCHRTLLARDILPKLGATFGGERS